MVDTLEKKLPLIDRNSNIIALRKFSESLKSPLRFDSGDILVKVKVKWYTDDQIRTYHGSIILMNHGNNAGNIGLTCDRPVMEDSLCVMIDIANATYSLGRSEGVLSVEEAIPAILDPFVRIDIEEYFNDFVLWNN